VNSQALQGDAVEAVRQLKSGTGPEFQIYGSSSFLQALIAADLIDEYLIRTYPLVLGRGKRLFEEGTPPRALRLVETEQSSTGVIPAAIWRMVRSSPDRSGVMPPRQNWHAAGVWRPRKHEFDDRGGYPPSSRFPKIQSVTSASCFGLILTLSVSA
jgi:RibD C-terminal domain